MNFRLLPTPNAKTILTQHSEMRAQLVVNHRTGGIPSKWGDGGVLGNILHNADWPPPPGVNAVTTNAFDMENSNLDIL